MSTQDYIRNLENQYFELQNIFETGTISEAQKVQLDNVKIELQQLPNNILSSSISKQKNVGQQKISTKL